MPSGDVAQATCFMLFIHFNFPYLGMMLGSYSTYVKYVTLVALARVYYQCHFIFDTIVGAAIGLVVGYSLNNVDLKFLTDLVAEIFFYLFNI